MSLDDLYRHVHHLAYRYHWSEAAILSMARTKRLRYLSLLADELDAARERRARE